MLFQQVPHRRAMQRPRFPWVPFAAGALFVVLALYGAWSLFAAAVGPHPSWGEWILLEARGIVIATTVTAWGLLLLLRSHHIALSAHAEADRLRHLLEVIMEGLPVGVFVSAADGQPVYANGAVQEMLGRGVAPGSAPAVAYPLYRRGTTDLYPEAELPLARVRNGKATAVADDVDVDAGTGRRSLRVWAAAVRDDDGEPTNLVAVVQDVTEVLAQERHEREVHQREVLERMRTRFINAAAHQLYTPLTPIRLQLALLRRTRDPARIEKASEMLERNIDRIQGLVSRILRVADLDAEGAVLDHQPCDLADLAASVVASLRPQAEEGGVTLGVQGRAKTVGDPDRLEGAVMDIVENAMKHSPRGGRVDIACWVTSTEACIEVRDEGPGFQGRVPSFERFANDALDKGWGMGLYIVHNVVTLHGGRTWARDEATGAAVGFAVPRKAVQVTPR